MRLNDLGKKMLADGWLCPSAPRDDLGAGSEAIVAMAETLAKYHHAEDTIDGEKPTLARVFKRLEELARSGQVFFSGDLKIILRGLEALNDVAHKEPGHIIGLVH